MCDKKNFSTDIVGIIDDDTFGRLPDPLEEIRDAGLTNAELLELIKAACSFGPLGKRETLGSRLSLVFELYMKVRKV